MKGLIREATSNDCASITILTKQLGYALSENDLRQNLESICRNNDEIVFVMTDEGNVIGWIHVFHAIRLESGSFAELGGLIVEEHYRGKGVGQLLLEKAKIWCRQRGIPKLKLRSNVTRKDAHRFYFRLGFKETKEQKVLEIRLKTNS